MKKYLAIIISSIVLVLGILTSKSYLWIPVSVLISGFIDVYTRKWVFSNRLGSAQTLSIFIKSLLSLFIMYAIVGQFVCVGLAVWWFT